MSQSGHFQSSGSPRRRRIRGERRGLAPLEFVLWLPLLLFLMALMVNYGTSAAWRVRGEIVARDAIWRTRWPRLASDEPPPDPRVWPSNASMGVAGDAQIASLDDPSINVPVVRGPLPNGISVRQVLSPLQGAGKGTSQISRTFPLLPKLGQFQSGEIAQPMLDGKLSGRAMGVPYISRRIPTLYQLPWPDKSQFVAAVGDAVGVSDRRALSLIDHDFLDRGDHWWFYRWAGYQPWQHLDIRYHGLQKPYGSILPRVGAGCTLDVREVYQRQVQRLIDVQQPDGTWRLGRISLVPRNLTAAYLGMFRSVERRMNYLLTLQPPDPQTPSAAERAFIQQHLAIVGQHIGELEQFERQIPGFENQMRHR